MTDTLNSETVKPGDSQTTVTTSTPPPQGNVVDPAEVERLRLENEKATHRVRQLENEAEARRKADDDAKRLRLEENEEYKQLAEQERLKREELENTLASDKRSQERKEATNALFSEFPKEVVELAEETGLSLTDTTDEAKAALKAKLEKIQARVVTTKSVTPNNPNTPITNTTDRAQLLERAKYGDKDARYQAISNIPAVQEMRKLAGYES